MTNEQLYLTIGIPSVLVLLNMIQAQLIRSELNGKIESLRTEIATELRAIRSDITMLTKMYGEHGERLAALEAGKK